MAATAPEWIVVADEEHGFSLRIPARTPSGRSVEIEQAARDGVGRVHAHSSDGSELYVEVVAYPGLIDHREATNEQRTSLSGRAPDRHLTRVRTTTLGGLPGTAFRFTGTLGGQRTVRRFVFIDSADRTCRVIYDPTSSLNRRVLRTLDLTL